MSGRYFRASSSQIVTCARMSLTAQFSTTPGSASCASDSPAVAAFAAQLSAVAPAAFELYIQGVTESNDDARLRSLREAARLQPQWDAPAFALGDT